MLEFIYFDPSSAIRIVSFSICIIFNIYFFGYEIYIYYDMIKYPMVLIGTEEFDDYIIKYGSMLRNIRYEEHK